MGTRTNFQDVQAFLRKFGIPAVSQPLILSPDVEEFRQKFMQEELNEFHDATTLQKKADALVDLVYVALGTADMMGIPWDAMWDAVQRANMRKERAKSAEHSAASTGRGHSLDVVKPEGWVSPDKEQMDVLAMASTFKPGMATERPTIESTMLSIALTLSKRATCAKMQVGCVIVDKNNRIIGTGYNGTPRGMTHCRPTLENWRHGDAFQMCAGHKAPSGADLCEAVHAEQNALLQCRNPDDAETIYVTTSPCQRCTKQLLNTGVKRIVFLKATEGQPQASELWRKAGRHWLHHKEA